jgi:hypothetical protein
MSLSASIQDSVAALLALPGALRVNVPIVERRPKELGDAIQAAAALGGGLCAHILPVLPVKIVDEAPFVHVERGELIVRFVEKPNLSAGTGANAWQLADDACTALHYAPKAAGTALGGILAHPLTLASDCLQSVEGKTDAGDDVRVVDVKFNANYTLSPGPATAVAIDNTFPSVAEALQACCQAQLRGSLSQPVPVFLRRDHDLASQIERAGNPVMIEVLTPMPARALQDVPFVFFERYEVRVKVTEYPPINSGLDAYEVVEEVMAALHWQTFGGDFLSYPLQLAERPTEWKDNLDRREIDVIFNATLGIEQAS